MSERICPGCGSTDVQQLGTSWRCESCQSTRGMTLAEIAEREPLGATVVAARLAAQGARCAVCGEVIRTPHRDEGRDGVLCHFCFVVIQQARSRNQTSELAAGWLRAVAEYLVTTEGA